MQHLIPGGPNVQVVTGPRGGDAGDGDSGVDIHVAAVIVAYNLDRGVPLVAQIFGAPLAEAVAGHVPAVAVGGKDGLAHAWAGEKIGKDRVYQPVNIGVDIAPPDPLLIIGGGGSNCKVVTLIAIQ